MKMKPMFAAMAGLSYAAASASAATTGLMRAVGHPSRTKPGRGNRRLMKRKYVRRRSGYRRAKR